MGRKNTPESYFSGSSRFSGGGSFEQREANRAWEKQQAEAQTSLQSRAALEKRFQKLPPEELIAEYLTLSQGVSSAQQRTLLLTISSIVRPGKTWLALLQQQEHKACQQLARYCLKQWSPFQTADALLQGIRKALYEKNVGRLQWLRTLTLEVAKKRATVPLRPVERLLWKTLKTQQRWRRSSSPLGAQVLAFHTDLIQLIAPADAPLAAAPPKAAGSLPLPSQGSDSVAESLPRPAEESTTSPEPGFWQRLLQRFRR